MKTFQVNRHVRFAMVAVLFLVAPDGFSAQRVGGGQRGGAPSTSRAAAPEDFTGQWVSLVTEDWRYRMITPQAGDYASVPVNPVGRKLADNWDPEKDEASGEQCKAYGAPAILRMPGRIRISWADDDTLRIETDAGRQTRIFHFKEPKSNGGDWQGVSQASWMDTGARGPVPGSGAGGAATAARPVGTLKVITTKMRSGYLRKNGVPYSDKAIVTEYFDRLDQPNGDTYLVVTTVVEDPMYLNQAFMTSSHFKKQNDQSGWNPTPCSAR
jgi:hypothetical protein